MKSIIQAELLKQKNTFHKKLVWGAPIITIFIAFLLMGGAYVQNGAYNWWYMLILPASVTMISSYIIASDKKRKFQGLFTILIDIKKLWYGKVVVSTIYLALMCIIFFISITVSGIIFGSQVSIINSLIASILLLVLFLWQIPLWMFVSMKIKTGFSVMLSVILNFGLSAICAIGYLWWVPFAIPARAMIPMLGIMPNGLNVESGSNLINSSVIPIGITISLGLFLTLSFITAKWFEKQEV